MLEKLFRIDNPVPTPWGKLDVTIKEMPNGEIRYRMKMPDGSTIHYTIAGSGDPAWQEGHFHKGYGEVYTVAFGVIAMALHEPFKEPQIRIYRRTNTVIVPAGVLHNVFPLRNAAFHTHTTGDPIGNPEKKGNDWWPATDLFRAVCESFGEREILAELAKS